MVQRVQLDLSSSKGWSEPDMVRPALSVICLIARALCPLRVQVALPILDTHGLRGGASGQPPQMVVPVSSGRFIPPDAIFSLLTQMPDSISPPTLAMVDSCATVVYIGVENTLPTLSSQLSTG